MGNMKDIGLLKRTRDLSAARRTIFSSVQPGVSSVSATFRKLTELEKKNGVVYTPNILAGYVAEKVVEYYCASLDTESNYLNLANIRIIDPACGNGELLISAWNALSRYILDIQKSNPAVVIPNPHKALCGIDIDDKAIYKTKDRIKSLSNGLIDHPSYNLLTTNALYPFNRRFSRQGWDIIKSRFDAPQGFDIVIANPPWGAEIDSYQDSLSNEEFSLYKGQFDTSDLFVELASNIIRPGGYFAFIIPDSLFNRERTSLRRLLLDSTEIKFIGRFGEKIFPTINRACAILICRKGKATDSTTVDCLRLSPELRKKIIKGESTFREADNSLIHKVHQSRFASNKDFIFDIYLREDEREILKIFNSSKQTFRDYLSSSRGVELSKSGRICRCYNCNKWLPYPSSKTPKCLHCKTKLLLNDIKQSIIIYSEPKEKSYPLIVGEGIERYLIKKRNWISTDRTGINYKDEATYKSPKIVVRKTGVGLLASIDYEGAMTNQVVYIFKCKQNIGTLPLEFFLALLNSRALYYYLVKSSGEIEWRSHPYLTQTQILDLPLPNIDLNSDKVLEIAFQIKLLLTPYLSESKMLPADIDAEVEYIIANLYGLSKHHYQFIYDTLKDVEQLLPIKSLNTVSTVDIFGN
jgi:SAM-dependent methyltransferase